MHKSNFRAKLTLTLLTASFFIEVIIILVSPKQGIIHEVQFAKHRNKDLYLLPNFQYMSEHLFYTFNFSEEVNQ